MASDIVGPFPKTKNNNIYILLFVDYFTRYIEATAIPNNTAEIVANKFIELIICRHGAPMKFLTDCGSNFTSQVMEYVINKMGVQHLKTSVYHYQSNGMVERLAKTIEEMLTMYVDEHQSDWDIYLPTILAFTLLLERPHLHSYMGEKFNYPVIL